MQIKNVRIAVPAWVLRRKTEIMYLVLGPDGLAKYKKFVETELSDQLLHEVNTHVNAYMSEGVMPPQEIASPILNLADDMLAGRTPTIRTGDYIALQQHAMKCAK